MLQVIVNDNGAYISLKDKSAKLNKMSSELVRNLTNIAEKWVQREAPRKTGRLKAMGHSKSVSADKGAVWIPKGQVPYSWYVIDGTRPHTIIPVSKRALFWRGASHPVKRVRHPGTKSNPYVDRAYENMQGEVDAEIQKFLDWIGAL